MGLSDRLKDHKRKLKGGYSVKDYVAPRLNQYGQMELHVPGASFLGPRTDIKRRINEGVKPTTYTDAAARRHDIDYHNINQQLKRGAISRKQAWAKVKASDNALMRSAMYNKMSINPLEHAHSNIALIGIAGKRVAQAAGLMPELTFVEGDGQPEPELTGSGRTRKKKKKRDPVGGLRKRFKKLGVKK
jgi:hypothetical protein